jgi:hypothetical protein
MSVSTLDRIASMQGRRDDVPNQELARDLATAADAAAIGEIAEGLRSKDARVQSDCIKVLYEIGYISPELIAPFVQEFLSLLKARNNRMVWGAMIALGTMAGLGADEIYPHVPLLKEVMRKGSVITTDNGIKILAEVAAKRQAYCDVLFPHLLEHLASCRQKEVPQHAEKTLATVNSGNWKEFMTTVEGRAADATDPQKRRIEKVLDTARRRGTAA